MQIYSNRLLQIYSHISGDRSLPGDNTCLNINRDEGDEVFHTCPTFIPFVLKCVAHPPNLLLYKYSNLPG